MEKMREFKRVKLSDGREVEVSSLTFGAYMDFIGVITDVMSDFISGGSVGRHFKSFIPVMAQMTGMTEEEIKNLKGADGMKILNTCIEVIKSDEDFLQELKRTTESLKQIIPSPSTQ
ncbi:hypothetical protein [Persephonella sp.]